MLFAHRQYGDRYNDRFGFWRWKDIQRPGSAELYLRRLYLFWTPLGGVMIHWFKTSDPNEALHDHPWLFASFVLRGRYEEDVMDVLCRGENDRHVIAKLRRRSVDWFNLKLGARATHAVSWIEPGTVTLVFTGPRTRKWGFWKLASGNSPHFFPCSFRWTYWREFLR